MPKESKNVDALHWNGNPVAIVTVRFTIESDAKLRQQDVCSLCCIFDFGRRKKDVATISRWPIFSLFSASAHTRVSYKTNTIVIRKE